MRTIKFRGLRKDGKGWVYGNLRILKHEDGRISYYIEEQVPYWYTEKANVYWEHRNYEVVPETVGQYTGLLDKGGVEIYEGDIVTWKKFKTRDCEEDSIEKSIIVWSEKSGKWTMKVDECIAFPLSEMLDCNDYAKVIGNIHQKGEEKK